MSKKNIIRAWKDPAYRASLSAEERAQLPESPVGIVELTDEELGAATGALAEIGLTKGTEICTVSGWEVSCGAVCTATAECQYNSSICC